METARDEYGEFLEVYNNRIDEELHNVFSDIAGVKISSDRDALEKFIREASQNVWTGALYRTGRRVFTPKREELRVKPYRQIHPVYGGLTNDYKYDTDKLIIILNIYIELCSIYDKVINVNGYAKLTGIDNTVVQSWYRNDVSGDEVSGKRSFIVKTLRSENENSLSEILGTGKRNPVAILGVLNHYHGWNMPHVSREIGERNARRLEELPSFGNLHNVIEQRDDGETSENAAK